MRCEGSFRCPGQVLQLLREGVKPVGKCSGLHKTAEPFTACNVIKHAWRQQNQQQPKTKGQQAHTFPAKQLEGRKCYNQPGCLEGRLRDFADTSSNLRFSVLRGEHLTCASSLCCLLDTETQDQGNMQQDKFTIIHGSAIYSLCPKGSSTRGLKHTHTHTQGDTESRREREREGVFTHRLTHRTFLGVKPQHHGCFTHRQFAGARPLGRSPPTQGDQVQWKEGRGTHTVVTQSCEVRLDPHQTGNEQVWPTLAYHYWKMSGREMYVLGAANFSQAVQGSATYRRTPSCKRK